MSRESTLWDLVESGLLSAADAETLQAGGTLNSIIVPSGILSADAAGRGKMASGYFDVATVLAKFAAGSLTEANVLHLFDTGAFTEANVDDAFAAGAIDSDRLKTDSFSTAVLQTLIPTGAYTEAAVDDLFAAGAIDGSDMIKAASIGADRLVDGAGVAALLTAGLGASITAAHAEDTTKTVAIADAGARVCLVMAVCTEDVAAGGGGTKPTFNIGETDTTNKFLADAALNAATAGDVFFGAGTLTATKALVAVIAEGTGTGPDPTGAFAITALILPAA